MKKSLTVIKVLLAIFTLTNFGLAVVAFIGGDVAIKSIKLFYGATINLTPQITHLIRMLGAMTFAVSFLGVMAFMDPVKNRAIISVAVFLLVVRAIEMMIFYGNITTHFNIAPARLIQNILSFLIMAILLFIFRPKAQ